jgi:hypothetical protein
MDAFVAFIILLIVISVLEKVLKAGKQKGKGAPPPPEVQGEVDNGQLLPKNLGDLIAEELGFNLERRPTVQQLPESPTASATTRPEVEAQWETFGVSERGAAADQTRVERARRRRRARPVRQRPPPPAERSPWELEGEQPVSLEERAIGERGEPISLERDRLPEDHDRFHDRYSVPQPVATHQEFHDRYVTRRPWAAKRRRAIRLPDRRYWSNVQRAIIWAEVLGPPKGLE